jgi:uncharacterized protein (TIGR02300 family)
MSQLQRFAQSAKGASKQKLTERGQRGFVLMTKPELGTKRLCANCSARYYDLNKPPIACPKCGTPFKVIATTARTRFEQRAVASQPEVAPEEAPSEISLDEDGTEDVETEETARDDSEDTLIEDVEEEDTDVSEIIGGDIEGEEET